MFQWIRQGRGEHQWVEFPRKYAAQRYGHRLPPLPNWLQCRLYVVQRQVRMGDGEMGWDGCVRYVPGTLPHFCWQKKHIWRNLNLQLWRVCSACVPFASFRKFLDSGLNIWQDKISSRSWIASHLLCLEIVCSSFVLDTCRTRTSARKECELMLSSFLCCCLLRCLDAFGFPGIHVFFLHVVVLGSTRCAFLQVCWTCLCEVHCCCLCCPVIINPVSSCSWCWLDDCVSMWLCSVWAIDGCGM